MPRSARAAKVRKGELSVVRCQFPALGPIGTKPASSAHFLTTYNCELTTDNCIWACPRMKILSGVSAEALAKAGFPLPPQYCGALTHIREVQGPYLSQISFNLSSAFG